MREFAGGITASYKERGFLGFVKAALNYPITKWRFPPYAKGIVLRNGKADQIRVLYVDTIYVDNKPWIKKHLDSRLKAYSKVSTLMSFDYRKLAQRYGQSKMNDMLVKTAVKFKPDLIQLGKSELIYGSTIRKIRAEIDTCIIYHYGDFRWELPPWVVEIGKHADCTLFWHKEVALIEKYKKLGIKNVGFAWSGTDPEKFYPRNVKKTKDVTFMGNNITTLPHNDGYQTRRELIEAILKKGLDLHIYGNNWEYLPHLPNVNIHPFVEEEEFAKVCSSSKITIGISGVNNVRMADSWRRTFNSMASGAFHLTHYVLGMEEVFENRKHLVWFNQIPEAIQLIEYYLAHDEERERIAEEGRQEVLAHHTWDIRIAEMLEIYRRIRQGKVHIPIKSKAWRKGKAYGIIAELCARYGESVLDIGCGGGIQYAAIRDVFLDVKYTGVDITPKMLKSAQELFPSVKFELGDAADLPYSDEEFDVTIVRHVFEHHPLSNGWKILHEALRVAKNAALFLFFVEPQEMEQDIIEQEEGRFCKNIYSKRWLINEIKSTLNNQCSINIIPIPKTKDSPALSDQVLYVIEKHSEQFLKGLEGSN